MPICLSNQRWYIYYSNGSGRYHFVNKAHLTKLLEQSYDAVDREVTLGNRYDYCCWELEKISTDEFEDTEDYVTKYGYETDYSISFALGMLSSIGENTAGSIAFDTALLISIFTSLNIDRTIANDFYINANYTIEEKVNALRQQALIEKAYYTGRLIADAALAFVGIAGVIAGFSMVEAGVSGTAASAIGEVVTCGTGTAVVAVTTAASITAAAVGIGTITASATILASATSAIASDTTLYFSSNDRASSAQLGKALGNKPDGAYAAHHIVPGKDGGSVGDEARAILKKFGIGINDADNGVWLPQSIHRGRHHKAYIDVVLRRLQNATNANDAKAILHSIATDLANGNLLL